MKKTSQKLKTYIWQGVNKNGHHDQGEINALNIRFARVELKKLGIEIKRIKQKYFFYILFQYKKRINSKDITLFFRQLATLLLAGIPIIQAFQTIADSTSNQHLNQLLFNLKNNIQTGQSLSTALQNYRQYFDALTCQLITAGEQTGLLDEMLNKIASNKEKNLRLKNKVKKALFYPLTVIGIAIIVTYVLMVFVVPQFATLFSEFGASLPLPTQIVIRCSDFIKSYGIITMLLITMFFYLIKFGTARFYKIGLLYDKNILKIPLFGPLIRNTFIAHFSRTLSITIASGVPIIETLEITATLTRNKLFHQAIITIIKSVTQGESLRYCLQKSAIFPQMVIQMVAIGEEAGKLEHMLTKIADFYESTIDQMVDTLSQLLEPFAMGVIGIIIGGLVIALYLPIFKLGMVF